MSNLLDQKQDIETIDTVINSINAVTIILREVESIDQITEFLASDLIVQQQLLEDLKQRAMDR